jgi:hypothetical protein
MKKPIELVVVHLPAEDKRYDPICFRYTEEYRTIHEDCVYIPYSELMAEKNK